MSDENVPVDPAQLPVEVPLNPPVQLPTLILLSGFDQLVFIFNAVAALIVNFKAGGRTLTNRQHAAIVLAAAKMKEAADQMHPADADE
jgi:hypothetical protein